MTKHSVLTNSLTHLLLLIKYITVNKIENILGGFCPGGFCPGGFCPRGILSRGILSGGFCPGGFCPGGFCPDTAQDDSRLLGVFEKATLFNLPPFGCKLNFTSIIQDQGVIYAQKKNQSGLNFDRDRRRSTSGPHLKKN